MAHRIGDSRASLGPESSVPPEEIQAARTVNPRAVNHTLAQRPQALALAEYGVDKKVAAAAAGLSTANGGLSVQRLMDKARRNGFNPAVSSVLKQEYIVDIPRSGGPKIVTAEKEAEIIESGKLVSTLSAHLLID